MEGAFVVRQHIGFPPDVDALRPVLPPGVSEESAPPFPMPPYPGQKRWVDTWVGWHEGGSLLALVTWGSPSLLPQIDLAARGQGTLEIRIRYETSLDEGRAVAGSLAAITSMIDPGIEATDARVLEVVVDGVGTAQLDPVQPLD